VADNALLAPAAAASPQVAQPATAAAAAAPAVAPAASAAPASTREALAGIVPDAVIDIRESNASTSPPIICRDLLKPNSNVHVRQCMTESDWQVYKRAEARRAEELTRMFQGGIFRRY
jgi:hypothetical protein